MREIRADELHTPCTETRTQSDHAWRGTGPSRPIRPPDAARTKAQAPQPIKKTQHAMKRINQRLDNAAPHPISLSNATTKQTLHALWARSTPHPKHRSFTFAFHGQNHHPELVRNHATQCNDNTRTSKAGDFTQMGNPSARNSAQVGQSGNNIATRAS